MHAIRIALYIIYYVYIVYVHIYHQIGGLYHYSHVIVHPIASQITRRTIVYLTVYPGADQRKHKSSASLAFVRGIYRWSVYSPHNWPVTLKIFPFDDVITIRGIRMTYYQQHAYASENNFTATCQMYRMYPAHLTYLLGIEVAINDAWISYIACMSYVIQDL